MSVTITEGKTGKWKVQIDNTDTRESILAKFVIKAKKGVPVSYFRFKTTFDMRDGSQMEVVDVRRHLPKSLAVEDIEKTANELTLLYPNLSLERIVVLWLKNKFRTKEELKEVMMVDSNLTQTLKDIDETLTFENIVELYENYKEVVEDEYQKVKRDVKNKENQKKNIRLMEKLELESSDINIVKMEYFIKINLSDEESLEDIFNSLDASESLPFIMYKRRSVTESWFKVYQFSKFPLDLIQRETLERGIYIKIKMNDGFITAKWNEYNIITLSLEEQYIDSKDVIFEEIQRALGDRVHLQVEEKGVEYLNATFIIYDVVINKAVFSDMVFNNDFMASFFMLKEINSVFTKSGGKNIVYYKTPGSSYKMIFTPLLGNDLKIKVYEMKTELEIENVKKTLCGLLGYYKDDYQVIVNEYTDIYPGSRKLIDKMDLKVISKDSDLKTGKKLRSLRNIMPEIFVSKYATGCQGKRQPRAITKSKADEIINNFKNGDKLVLLFPGEVKERFGKEYAPTIKRKSEYMTCISETEVKTGVIKTGSPYPGLIKNNTSSKNDYPYIPCCYDNVNRVPRKEKGFEQHILSSSKFLPAERLGSLPLYIRNIAEEVYEGFIGKNKVKYNPVLRFGVAETLDSFLHCTELAFNEKYELANEDVRSKRVLHLRKKLSKMNFAPARQELYEFSDNHIRSMLLNTKQYIDPQLWVRLTEIYYSKELKQPVNIILFIINNDFPNGDFLLPHHAKVYFRRDIKSSDRTVFIIKRPSQTKKYPYQCEIICKLKKEGKKVVFHDKQFSFKDEEFQSRIIDLYKRSNKIHIIGSDLSKCSSIV